MLSEANVMEELRKYCLPTKKMARIVSIPIALFGLRRH